MPSQPAQPAKQNINSTLVLGFINPQTQEFVSTATLELLPASGVLRIAALKDIPEGSVAYLPMNNNLLQQASDPVDQAAQAMQKFSSFDHK